MSSSFLLSGARTPIGKLSGALAGLSAAQLGGIAITAAALATYARLRDDTFPTDGSPSFFISTTGHRLSESTLHATFLLLVRAAGLEPSPSSRARRPRPHDVRHSFAVSTLVAWYRAGEVFDNVHSGLRAWAIEGTSAHGAGLTRHLARSDEFVVELDRPERQKRRNGAKSDPLDAIRCAREALSRTKLGTPRTTGARQALSVLLAARRLVVDGSGDAQRQLFGLVIAAPEQLRSKLRNKKLPEMVRIAASLRVRDDWDLETRTTASVLRDLGRRVIALTKEAARHEKAILAIVREWRPDLLAQRGVGPIVAATVLCAWSHPGRIRSEAAFAKLSGTAPIPANSGKVTTHYRLNPYGDRRLNWAIHTVVLSRLHYDDDTKDYVKRRTAEGKTSHEIRRCLKRYVARELFRLLENEPSMS